MKVLISACLLGLCCRYDGASRDCGLELPEDWELVPFCPEIYGGLPTPRTPAEIKDGKVITRDGRDVTAEYERGAREAVRLVKKLKITKAVLKERSPSCGKGFVYDGSFGGTLTPGDGVAARALKNAGIEILGESEITRKSD